MERRDKINYYLDLADVVAKRGTCLRRLYGAVIVKNDEVIATGYVGAPRGRKNCSDLGVCIRQKMNIPRREAATGEYIANSCSCSMCKRMIINAGIKTVYVRDDEHHYRVIPVLDWIEKDESLTGDFGY